MGDGSGVENNGAERRDGCDTGVGYKKRHNGLAELCFLCNEWVFGRRSGAIIARRI